MDSIASMRSTLRILATMSALAVAPSALGCEASPRDGGDVSPRASAGGEAASSGTITSVSRASAGDAALGQEAEERADLARRERRIRELESRLAMADAEVRDLRGQLDTRDFEVHARPTVRIGDARASIDDDATLALDVPPRETARGMEREVERDGETEEDHDRGPRPVLRLYGAAPPPSVASYPAPEAPIARPIPTVTMPSLLPPPPVARGLGPLPVAGSPGSRASVPPIPEVPVPVIPNSPLATAPSAVAPSAVAPSSPRPGSASPSDDPVAREYRAALEHVAARRFDQALGGLTAFLAAHPQHPYADNAMYWRAEVFYIQRDYASAERELTRLLERFPRGNKVADALLRLGFCRQRQGDAEGARAYFRRVRTEHPGTMAARLAMREDT